jgi:hypothetical protein
MPKSIFFKLKSRDEKRNLRTVETETNYTSSLTFPTQSTFFDVSDPIGGLKLDCKCRWHNLKKLLKKRDVTGQLNFLFRKFNDLHVWKLPNFIQLCKLFMVSLDFERFFIWIFTHDVTVFFSGNPSVIYFSMKHHW